MHSKHRVGKAYNILSNVYDAAKSEPCNYYYSLESISLSLSPSIDRSISNTDHVVFTIETQSIQNVDPRLVSTSFAYPVSETQMGKKRIIIIIIRNFNRFDCRNRRKKRPASFGEHYSLKFRGVNALSRRIPSHRRDEF